MSEIKEFYIVTVDDDGTDTPNSGICFKEVKGEYLPARFNSIAEIKPYIAGLQVHHPKAVYQAFKASPVAIPLEATETPLYKAVEESAKDAIALRKVSIIEGYEILMNLAFEIDNAKGANAVETTDTDLSSAFAWIISHKGYPYWESAYKKLYD